MPSHSVFITTLTYLYIFVLIAFSHYRWYTLGSEVFLGGGTASQDVSCLIFNARMVWLLCCLVVSALMIQPFKVVSCFWIGIRYSPDGYIEVHGGIFQGDRCLYYSHPSVSNGTTWQPISSHASHTIFCLRLPYYTNYLRKATEIDTWRQEWW